MPKQAKLEWSTPRTWGYRVFLKPKCLVETCLNPSWRQHSYCKRHFYRWRKYGDPTAGGIFKGSLQRVDIRIVVTLDGDEVLGHQKSRPRSATGEE